MVAHPQTGVATDWPLEESFGRNITTPRGKAAQRKGLPRMSQMEVQESIAALTGLSLDARERGEISALLAN